MRRLCRDLGVNRVYTSEALLAYISLAVVGVVLLLLIVEHFERRLARRVSDANREVVKDIAVLHGEAKTLVEFARLGVIGTAAPHPATPVGSPQPSLSPEVSEQLREINAQLRELNRAITSLAAPPAQSTTTPVAVEAPAVAPAQPSPASPPPAREATASASTSPSRPSQRPSVSARVLDAVLTDNLSNSLVYMHEQGGTVASEHEIPGSSQAVAKLLSLRLARADDRGIYLTDAGRDIASLLTSVSR